MLRDPQAYAGGVLASDGGDWLAGEHVFGRRNPRHVVAAAWFHVARLFLRCQGGMGGLAHLPEPGGMNAQPAWLMAAFGFLGHVQAEAQEAEQRRRGAGGGR